MPELLTIEGDLTDVVAHYEDNGWTDGLPIVPPTDGPLKSRTSKTRKFLLALSTSPRTRASSPRGVK